MYKNRRHPTEAECRLLCCPILLSRCRFCSFLKLLSYRHTPKGVFFVVEEDGVEPSKSVTTDLQSAPFGRSGTPPYSVMSCGGGAGGRIRTPDLLITNQLLYRLSYTSVSAATILLYHSPGAKSSPKIQFFAAKQSGSRPTGQGAAVYSPSGRSQLSMCSSR